MTKLALPRQRADEAPDMRLLRADQAVWEAQEARHRRRRLERAARGAAELVALLARDLLSCPR